MEAKKGNLTHIHLEVYLAFHLTHTHTCTPTYVATVMTDVRSLILEAPDRVGLDVCVRLQNLRNKKECCGKKKLL